MGSYTTPMDVWTVWVILGQCLDKKMTEGLPTRSL